MISPLFPIPGFSKILLFALGIAGVTMLVRYESEQEKCRNIEPGIVLCRAAPDAWDLIWREMGMVRVEYLAKNLPKDEEVDITKWWLDPQKTEFPRMPNRGLSALRHKGTPEDPVKSYDDPRRIYVIRPSSPEGANLIIAVDRADFTETISGTKDTRNPRDTTLYFCTSCGNAAEKRYTLYTRNGYSTAKSRKKLVGIITSEIEKM